MHTTIRVEYSLYIKILCFPVYYFTVNIQECLEAHNSKRDMHGAELLAVNATDWALLRNETKIKTYVECFTLNAKLSAISEHFSFFL